MPTVRIDTKAWDGLLQRVAEIGKRNVRVGLFEGDVARIGAFHELGTATIPERSWLRSTFRERENELATVMARACAACLAGKVSVDRMLDLVGSWAANAVKAKIRSNIPPPLALATIRRKGSSTALIDTGRMLNAVTWKIVA